MPEEDVSFARNHELMSPAEMETLAKIFVGLGVKKIRLTGGEPLVRKEAAEIIARLSQLPVELTLTTNGLRLHEFLPAIQKAGIHSLNISLDTLNADTFQLITRRTGFEKVMQNIQLAISEGIHVKVNVVAMKGINDAELVDFAAWTLAEPVHVRFIEFMPFDGNHWNGNKVISMQEILDKIGEKYEIIPLGKEPHATANKFFIPGAKGSFAVISTMSHPFCSDCNRLRLTADGKMKNCLFSESETDLLGALRNGEELEPLIVKNLMLKKEKLGGQWEEKFEELDAEKIHNRSMIRIGG